MPCRTCLQLLFVVILSISLQAQNFTISGYVQDAESGEKLIGAHIYDPLRQVGTTSNRYGFFSLTLPRGSFQVAVAYIGYRTNFQELDLQNDVVVNFSLLPSAVAGDTVLVTGEAIELIENQTQMSSIDVPLTQIRSIPALLGEVDVLKTLQLLPGVQSGNEGTSGIYVRGGGPDQNLLLLDGAPVYNASHLFGFFSVFNSDAIKHVQLTKGGFPARFGGRLSSVVEIDLKDGHLSEFHGAASIGLIASRFTIEGPIQKDKTSFIFSGRRTYIDLLARPFQNEETGTGGYFFYDINAKLNHKFSERDRVYFSIYTGDDKFYADDNGDELSNDSFHLDIDWGNLTSTLRWNHVWNKKLFSNSTLIYSKYQFETIADEEGETFDGQTSRYFARYFSGVRDWGAGIDFDYIPNPSNTIKFGADAVLHRFSPGAFQLKADEPGQTPFDSTISGSGEIDASEISFYAEDEITLSPRFSLNLGIHGSIFNVNNAQQNSVQPRVSARYKFSGGWAVKASFATMSQNIHLLTNSGIGLPTDLWVPATEAVGPQKSKQYALGIARSLWDKQFELSVEAYYKTMEGLIEFEEGATFIGIDKDWQSKVEIGEGQSYGFELFLQKKRGETSGWLGYTLSWSDRTFEGLNFGNTFPYKYDRRHDISLVMTRKISGGFELSGTWVYGTGNAISLPTARFQGSASIVQDFFGFGENLLSFYKERNGFRMAAYHRLDIGIQFIRGTAPRQHIWSLGLYNAYSRKNPFFLYLDRDDGERVIKQVSLFPIIPSLSYRYSF